MEEERKGMLYLCATPIGNLEDITARVLRILGEADLIAAEDTRSSMRLLQHFDIHTPMTSYHKNNRIEKAYVLVREMQKGKTVALITDAGMPAISDPGEDLVRICREQGIPVTALPGACACVTALTLSGLPTRRFCFEGFLPTDKKERAGILSELAGETRTIVLYEAPHRLIRTLRELYEAIGDRRVRVCRELTKKHETVFAATLAQALAYYETEPPRGECVLVVEGKDRSRCREEERERWRALDLEEHLQLYLDQGLEKKEAMKRVARDRGVGKSEIYRGLQNGIEKD